MFLNTIIIFSNYFSRLIGIPIFKLFAVVIFFTKFIFLGYDSAFITLSRFDRHQTQILMRLLGAKIGNKCIIESGIRFHNCKNLRNLTIGDNCHIGKDCFFDLRGVIIIQDNVTVSMKTSFITHQDLGFSNLSTIYPSSMSNISLKNNVYIGANCTILKGVEIGESSIVSACSCVNKSIPSNVVFGGVPSKKIKNIYGI